MLSALGLVLACFLPVFFPDEVWSALIQWALPQAKRQWAHNSVSLAARLMPTPPTVSCWPRIHPTKGSGTGKGLGRKLVSPGF